MSNPKKPLPEANKNPAFFILATVCASPFAILSGYIVTGFLTHQQKLLHILVLSMFFAPVLLVVALVAFVFIVLAWIKSHDWCKPFLFLYATAILTYWTALVNSGPW